MRGVRSESLVQAEGTSICGTPHMGSRIMKHPPLDPIHWYCTQQQLNGPKLIRGFCETYIDLLNVPRGLWRQTEGLNALTTNACGQSAWWKLPRGILRVFRVLRF